LLWHRVGPFSSRLKRVVCGQVDAADVVQGGRSTLALPWWAFARASGEVGGDGGGFLANMGLNRVGTHLKGPVTVLLVLVSHSEGGRWAGREGRGWWGTGKQMVVVVTGDMGSSHL